MLTWYGTTLKVGGRSSTSISCVSCNNVSGDVRYDGKEHHVIPTSLKKGEDAQAKDVLQVVAQCDVNIMWDFALNISNYFISQYTWV